MKLKNKQALNFASSNSSIISNLITLKINFKKQTLRRKKKNLPFPLRYCQSLLLTHISSRFRFKKSTYETNRNRVSEYIKSAHKTCVSNVGGYSGPHNFLSSLPQKRVLTEPLFYDFLALNFTAARASWL